MPLSYSGCSFTEWISKRFGVMVLYIGVILRQSNCKYDDKQNYNDATCVLTCLEYLNCLSSEENNFRHEEFYKLCLTIEYSATIKRATSAFVQRPRRVTKTTLGSRHFDRDKN